MLGISWGSGAIRVFMPIAVENSQGCKGEMVERRYHRDLGVKGGWKCNCWVWVNIVIVFTIY